MTLCVLRLDDVYSGQIQSYYVCKLITLLTGSACTYAGSPFTMANSEIPVATPSLITVYIHVHAVRSMHQYDVHC